MSATGMNFHGEEREVLSGTRKEEFQRKGNVVSERKGRIVSDGKGWLSADRKVRIFHDRKGKRKGEVEKDGWKVQYTRQGAVA